MNMLAVVAIPALNWPDLPPRQPGHKLCRLERTAGSHVFVTWDPARQRICRFLAAPPAELTDLRADNGWHRFDSDALDHCQVWHQLADDELAAGPPWP